MPRPNQKMFVHSYIFQKSIKNNLTKFLILSKLFANFDFTIVNVSKFSCMKTEFSYLIMKELNFL